MTITAHGEELAYWKATAKEYKDLANYWNTEACNRPSVLSSLVLSLTAGIVIGLALATLLAINTCGPLPF